MDARERSASEAGSAWGAGSVGAAAPGEVTAGSGHDATRKGDTRTAVSGLVSEGSDRWRGYHRLVA
jgi:hypothetical protein